MNLDAISATWPTQPLFLNCEMDAPDMWEISNSYFELRDSMLSISLYGIDMSAKPRIFLDGEEQPDAEV